MLEPSSQGRRRNWGGGLLQTEPVFGSGSHPVPELPPRKVF